MNPKLIVIAGPHQGAVFELHNVPVTIGRDAANAVRIQDPSVSRRHCLISKDGGRYKIADCDSFNGTFVNGVPVAEQFLEHGDHVAVGDLLLLFLMQEAEECAPPSVLFNDGNMATRSTVRLRKHDAFYLQPEKVLAALPPTARVARDLGALLKISTVVNSVHGLENLQRRLLELTLEVVPAERGTILLAGRDADDLMASAAVSSLPGVEGGEEISVNRAAATQALKEDAAFMSNDLTAEPGSPESGRPVTALICVPLTCMGKAVGVIYLDTRNPATVFDERHLQLTTAIAGIAAVAIENARQAELLEGENRRLVEEINLNHQMVGGSGPMRELYRFLGKVAASDATVLLRGESGTGKELAARAIHQNGARARKPFVAINCATLSESLLESELFGHEKGAFTGAVSQKRGKLEMADGGTVFLDEVGELAQNVQAKLLRVLQEREFERVGGTRIIKTDIKVIAATNRDLEEAVKAGTFRRDLYYRLNVISFTLPPLRDRREDIPLLANYFAAECSRRAGRKPVRVSAEARSHLLSYPWPGNVRELENVIERAVVLGSTDVVLPEDLPEALLENDAFSGAPIAKFYDVLREMKKQMLLDALRQAGGSYAEAAKLLGIHPNNLHRLMKNMNLKTGPVK